MGLELEQEIPDWIKNNAKWWSENKIPDEDFVKSDPILGQKRYNCNITRSIFLSLNT